MTISIHSHPAVSDDEFMAYWQARKAEERARRIASGELMVMPDAGNWPATATVTAVAMGTIPEGQPISNAGCIQAATTS